VTEAQLSDVNASIKSWKDISKKLKLSFKCDIKKVSKEFDRKKEEHRELVETCHWVVHTIDYEGNPKLNELLASEPTEDVTLAALSKNIEQLEKALDLGDKPLKNLKYFISAKSQLFISTMDMLLTKKKGTQLDTNSLASAINETVQQLEQLAQDDKLPLSKLDNMRALIKKRNFSMELTTM
jgi:hypothetical protein